MKKSRPICCFIAGTLFLFLAMALSASAQNLFEGDFVSSNVCEITPTGAESILSVATNRYDTYAVAFDSAGNLFVAERGAPGNSHRIVKITPDGVQSIYFTFTNSPFDGIPYGMAFDSSGNMYVSSFRSSPTSCIYKFSPTGTASVITAFNAVSFPVGLAFDKNGDLFVADRSVGILDFTNYNGVLSSNRTIFASLQNTYGIVFDAANNLYAAVSGPSTNSILKFDTNGTASVVAFGPGFNGLAIDGNGNLFATADTNIIEFSTNGQQTVFVYNHLNGTSLAFQPAPDLQGAVANGMFQLSVTMPTPYYTTVVQTSSNLVNWIDVCTNTPPFSFTDSIAAASLFYRALLDTNYY